MSFITQILVNNIPITEYNHEGDKFVEGRPGSLYSIRIQNNTGKRVKAVVSVDGLDVISGELASENSPGYILNPYEVQIIGGWRVSDNEIREFKFGKSARSYANKSGYGTSNNGVIGVLYFNEKVERYNTWYSRNIWQSYENPMMPYTTLSCNTAQANLGTEMGESQISHVKEVGFNSLPQPYQTDIIYYDDRRGLESRGIIVDQKKLRPNPFPASNNKYCRVY